MRVSERLGGMDGLVARMARVDLATLPRRLVERVLPGPVVLMYHRVADVPVDPWSLVVSPANFAAQVEVLVRHCEVLPMPELARLHREGRLPRRAVGITFDDGYADNLHLARPVCERFQAPATVFVTTGSIGCAKEFFWDEIERILLSPGVLPAELEIEVAGRTHRFSLGEDARYDEAAQRRDRGYRAEGPAPTRRHVVYAELNRLLKAASADQREAALGALRAWAGAAPSDRRLAHPMTADEVRALAAGGLVAVGAHTVTHRVLPDLPEAEQREELVRCREALEALLGCPVTGLAYPHGRFDATTARLAREVGFDYACSTVNKAVRPADDLWALPRVFARNWTGEQFARHLSRYIRGLG
jgi:peptidoglycan/xylan/chitin deacetylase (PgdA/CDA1 family)